MDIDYSSDREAFKGLINAKRLLSLFNDQQMIRQIYNTARNRVGEDPMLMQQEAIFELNSPGGSLDKATDILQKAYKIAPYNKAISHSLSELALKKADKASTQLEKNKFRQESKDIAYQLISKDPISGHPYHTIIKIGLDELSELMEKGDESTIERKIKEVEKIIAQALQSYPDDSIILATEASFCSLINRNPQALESLKKAFSLNKRSPYLATRLAKIYEINGEEEKAIQTLRECVEANPSDKYANFKLAVELLNFPGASKIEIRHHLRRSFTEGDSNYTAQFYYARFLYLEGDYNDASQIFRTLGEANIDTRIKKEPRGIVKEDDVLKRYTGTIIKLESSYGFIIRDAYQDKIFTHRLHNKQSDWQKLATQMRVSFELVFNYRGPCAIHVNIEEKPS